MTVGLRSITWPITGLLTDRLVVSMVAALAAILLGDGRGPAGAATAARARPALARPAGARRSRSSLLARLRAQPRGDHPGAAQRPLPRVPRPDRARAWSASASRGLADGASPGGRRRAGPPPAPCTAVARRRSPSRPGPRPRPPTAAGRSPTTPRPAPRRATGDGRVPARRDPAVQERQRAALPARAPRRARDPARRRRTLAPRRTRRSWSCATRCSTRSWARRAADRRRTRGWRRTAATGSCLVDRFEAGPRRDDLGLRRGLP